MSLEQVHVIGKICRGLRLYGVAGFALALALSPVARAVNPLISTSTTLSAQSSTQTCPTSTSATQLTTTLTTLTIAVTGSTGVPSGTVSIFDNGGSTAIATATLNTGGQATVSLYLSGGLHSLTAQYLGNSSYSASAVSNAVSATISAQCTTQFAVSISNIVPSTSGAMTLTQGDSGTATVTVTPSEGYVASLSGAPAFITVSCSGLPSPSSCTFTPENLEILPGQDAGVISSLLIGTTSPTARAVPPAPLGHRSHPVAWAVLLPGMLGLGGLAWGARRRRWLQRLSLVLLVGMVTALGTTGCNPLYDYHRYPPSNLTSTPTGTYNITIAGQSSNGVTADTITTTLVLTVQ